VIECKGPTNTRVYTVAVYFRGNRLAKASGHSIQQAEMNAAKEALDNSQGKYSREGVLRLTNGRMREETLNNKSAMKMGQQPTSRFEFPSTPSSSKLPSGV
ncbi:hypothetical protein L9F63_019520, partial [Diploptera punctata]